MEAFTPCSTQPLGLHLFNAAMNVIQAVLVALIAARAVRKNREDKRRNGHESQ